MRAAGFTGLVRAAAALWLASATLLASGTAPPAEPGEKGRHSDDVFTPLLERRLEAGASRDDLMIDIRWPDGGMLAACRLYGNGVGIWNREIQFRLDQKLVRSLLKTLVEIRFGAFPTTVGGDEEAGEETQKGRITVSVGAVRKTVVQVEPGEQSPQLRKFADRLLQAARPATEKGVRASSFGDAFEKLASGQLAPETLEVTLQRKARDPATAGQEGWRLWIDGRQVQDRALGLGHGRGHAPARILFLSRADFGKLVRLIRTSQPASLPQNLYAERYTDLAIQVLKQHEHLQARQFAGMTPETLGEKQKTFDRLLEGLVALHDRAQREGRPVEPVDLTGPSEGERERERENRKEGGEEANEAAPASPTPSSPEER
jgi:hypothetical protein